MARIHYSTDPVVIPDGSEDIILISEDRVKECSVHQASFVPAAGASGTYKLAYVCLGQDINNPYFAEYVKVGGVDVEIDISVPSNVTFERAIEGFALVPQTAIVEGCTVVCAGW